jgi:hypothetical protein
MAVSGGPLEFPAAPWSGQLKIISFLGSLLLCVVGLAAYRAIPVAQGFTHQFGLLVAAVPVLVPFCASLFVVRGYAIDGKVLFVRRLLWSTRIPLHGLDKVWLDPAVCKGAIRVVGNGGLFSFSGLFYSKALGKFRVFVTDFSQAAVLKLAGQVVVLSPKSPHAFVEHLQHRFADLVLEPAEKP